MPVETLDHRLVIFGIPFGDRARRGFVPAAFVDVVKVDRTSEIEDRLQLLPCDVGIVKRRRTLLHETVGIVAVAPIGPDRYAESEAAFIAASVAHRKGVRREISGRWGAALMKELDVVDPFSVNERKDPRPSVFIGVVYGERKGELLVVFQRADRGCNIGGVRSFGEVDGESQLLGLLLGRIGGRSRPTLFRPVDGGGESHVESGLFDNGGFCSECNFQVCVERRSYGDLPFPRQRGNGFGKGLLLVIDIGSRKVEELFHIGASAERVGHGGHKIFMRRRFHTMAEQPDRQHCKNYFFHGSLWINKKERYRRKTVSFS